MLDLILRAGLRRAARLGRRAVIASLQRQGVAIGAGVQLYGRPIVTRAPGSTITIGARSTLISRCSKNLLGVNHAVVLRTLAPGARLEIGEDVGMSGVSICAAGTVSIGDGTMLGANVVIVDTDFHSLSSPHRRYLPLPAARPQDRVLIGKNVFIGTNAIVLKGVHVGDHAVIGAGAVVTSSVPAGAICAGNPGRVVSNGFDKLVLDGSEVSTQRRDED